MRRRFPLGWAASAAFTMQPVPSCMHAAPIHLLQGQFFSSGADNRAHFVGVFGEELAHYILALIKQDAR